MKKTIPMLVLLMCLVLLFTACDEEDDSSDSSSGGSWFSFATPRESTTNKRAGKDMEAESVTILVYMIASDLESDAGCATTDIEEMCNATLSGNVKVVLQTGGTKTWNNDIMSRNQVERFRIKKGTLKKIETVGKCKNVNMASANTLSNFISWGIKKYPADRVGVVLWDHGGGTMLGFGVDEYHPDDSLGIDDIAKAFKKAKAKVNFIGFDACLMGTIETAYALSDYADYMIASEETEPGSGWYYTNWLSELSKNPGLNMKALSKTLIQDYVEGEDASFFDDMTLALYDLKDAKKTYASFCNYLKDSRKALKNHGFKKMANARIDVRSYGDDEYEQIDIRSYIEQAGIEDAEFEANLEHMIVYYNGNIDDSTGMAMYYPYSYLDYYKKMIKLMDKIGMDDKNHRGFFNDFVSILANGKTKKSSTKAKCSTLEQLIGETQPVTEENYENEEWYDAEAADSGYDAAALFTTDEDLVFTEKGDQLILDLTEEQWNSIAKVEMELYVKDEYGYQFLGYDSLVNYDNNGDLIGDFDFQWLTINEQFVPFFIISDVEEGELWQATGYVPAMLNAGTADEKDIDLYIRWDNDHEDGYIMGYTTYKNDSETISMANKNYLALKAGDTLDFYCDYYKKNGDYDDSYYIGDTLKVTDKELKVQYMEFDEETQVQIGYCLTDIYQNEYWTEQLEYGIS